MLTTEEILGIEGRIAQRLPHYEHRPEQLEMAAAVSTAIENSQHLIAEAGTGIGKSFAYLVPAILAVTANQEASSKTKKHPQRVVISTHTIALQEQLLQKDIPLLNSVIPREFSTVLVKGRSNYLSRRRMDLAFERGVSLFDNRDELQQLRDLNRWAKSTNDGTLSDLSVKPLSQVWDEVASDHGNCLGTKCPQHQQCFYYADRRRVRNAQVLIVNHALFFSDLALRRAGVSLLPDYDIAIFDEAHTLEQVAGNHLGLRITSGQIDYTLNKLYNDRRQKGLLVHHKMIDAQQEVDRCRILAEDFFSDLYSWLISQNSKNGRVKRADIVRNQLSPALRRLSHVVLAKGDMIHTESERQDFKAAGDRLRSIAAELEVWVSQSSEDTVYWIEQSNRRQRPRLVLLANPLDVGSTLRSELFDAGPTTIMTSATLSIENDDTFDFFKSQVGLTVANSLRLGSPFDYQEQATLVTLKGMADPSGEPKLFEEHAAAMIRRYVQRSQGRAFVLFTNYELMRQLAGRLFHWFAENNMTFLNQADGGPRSELLNRFKSSPQAVLFGTDSFWQGVDVPGDALQNVIITKLPFSVPNQPLTEARLEAIRRRGGNPFRDYQLPEAILKFRQGFGRLIRSQQDHGMVVVLDPRISTKSYGRLFIDSLPDCRHVVDTVD